MLRVKTMQWYAKHVSSRQSALTLRKRVTHDLTRPPWEYDRAGVTHELRDALARASV